jgi:hypothetical protein
MPIRKHCKSKSVRGADRGGGQLFEKRYSAPPASGTGSPWISSPPGRRLFEEHAFYEQLWRAFRTIPRGARRQDLVAGNRRRAGHAKQANAGTARADHGGWWWPEKDPAHLAPGQSERKRKPEELGLRVKSCKRRARSIKDARRPQPGDGWHRAPGRAQGRRCRAAKAALSDSQSA